MRAQPESLDERFQRLRTVVTAWESRYQQLPAEVLACFRSDDMDSINRLLVEKRRLGFLIPEFQEFIDKWEDEVAFVPVLPE